MVIRVKQGNLKEEKIKKRKKKERAREKEKNTEESKSIGEVDCLIHDPSVEVGYGLCYFIVNSK